MKTAKGALGLAAMGVATAMAGPGHFEVVVDRASELHPEERALHGLVFLQEGVAAAKAVGTIGRAFSLSAGPDNTLWGVVTEAINFPGARGNVVGLESAVVNMSAANTGELRGVDIVFKNRMDVSYGEAVPAVGANRFNDRSAAVYVSSQPRSPAGEYSGWQAGLKFGRHSLDRTVDVPYAAAIDLTEVESSAPYYLMVWRCGAVKCGLRPTDQGATIVVDIDRR